MIYKKLCYPEVPPKLAGHYRIRDGNGDIIYWGDAANLFAAWSAKLENNTFSERDVFEYALDGSAEVKHAAL